MVHFKEPKNNAKEGKNKYFFGDKSNNQLLFSLETQVKRVKAKKVREEEILGRQTLR